MVSGMVFKPAFRSASISRISKGMVMARMKRKRSNNIKNTDDGKKCLSACITGINTVTAVHTIAMRKIFTYGIRLRRRLLNIVFVVGSEYNSVISAIGDKAMSTSFLAISANSTNPMADSDMRM